MLGHKSSLITSATRQQLPINFATNEKHKVAKQDDSHHIAYAPS
jgi:hypothetical protein